jgi:hypothetical protein
MMIIASWIPSLVTNNCRKSSKPRRPTGTVYFSDQVSLMKHDLADLPVPVLDRTSHAPAEGVSRGAYILREVELGCGEWTL